MKPNLATFLLIAGIVGAAIPTRASDYETVTFAAPALGGMTVSVNVILPRNYATSKRRFPVLYLLDGFGGDHMTWVTKSRIVRDAAAYNEIIVMPDYGVSSWYVNSQANPSQRWEDFMIQDLIPYVDSHYQTIATRQGRGTAGDSMGGYGAMMLGLKHADMFTAVASLSGTLRCAEWDGEKRLGPDFRNRCARLLALRITRHAPPRTRSNWSKTCLPRRCRNSTFRLGKGTGRCCWKIIEHLRGCWPTENSL